MTILKYEYNFEGLLTAIFEVFYQRLEQVQIMPMHAEVSDLFAEIQECWNDVSKSERVWNKMEDLLGKSGLQTLWKAWLSERRGIEAHILEAIRYALAEKKNVLSDYTHLSVLEIQAAVKSVDREKHRMEAFVRFQELVDGSFYAVVEPDFNVLPLIIPHFTNRYADQKWIIYDRRRGFGIHYDRFETKTFTFEETPLQRFEISEEQRSEREQLFQNLWSDYFTNTNIKARKNMKLHLQHVPRRYWKLLTEKHR